MFIWELNYMQKLHSPIHLPIVSLSKWKRMSYLQVFNSQLVWQKMKKRLLKYFSKTLAAADPISNQLNYPSLFVGQRMQSKKLYGIQLNKILKIRQSSFNSIINFCALLMQESVAELSQLMVATSSSPQQHQQESAAAVLPASNAIDQSVIVQNLLSFLSSLVNSSAALSTLASSSIPTRSLTSDPTTTQQQLPSVIPPPSTNDLGSSSNVANADGTNPVDFLPFLSSLTTSSGNLSTSTLPPESSTSTALLPYLVPTPSSSAALSSKKRINRGRPFKAHKGIYNVVVAGQVPSADYAIDELRQELALQQADLPPIIVEDVNVIEKLADTIDLLPHLNNPSHCGAVVAGHLFPRDYFIDHILRDVEGNVKAAKGFINHSNREPLSREASKLFFDVLYYFDGAIVEPEMLESWMAREASKLFFDVLYYFGGAIVEPEMLESWMWVARKSVNDRGNTSKSGRGVRYFVKPDYGSVLQGDIWAEENSS